ncbi:hypothetical protein PMAYCL1PPCAC_26715, partial [Pristionchus mayeri]
CSLQLGVGINAPFSTPEDELSKRIDKELEDEKKIKILKILLLGPGESGKSTTLKQMKIIHAEGYSTTDLMSKRDVVYHNLFNGIKEAIKEAQNQNLPLDEEMMEDIRKIEKHSEKMRTMDIHPIPQEVSKAIERVFESSPIQYVIYRLVNSPVDDAGRYFLEQLKRVTASDYLPTVQDVLKSRVATQGCVQMSFFIKDFTFNVYDVGGQRSQRKKWLHIFDNVHAVLFITSLSEYNQKLIEDGTTNRMRESLGLFGNICKNEYFKQTAIILFLNKKDLFEEKIRKYPITDCFPRYKGPQAYNESLQHITKRFLRENGNQKRQVYTHVTCATDTQQIQVVIDSVIDVIIQQTMQKIGIQ